MEPNTPVPTVVVSGVHGEKSVEADEAARSLIRHCKNTKDTLVSTPVNHMLGIIMLMSMFLGTVSLGACQQKRRPLRCTREVFGRMLCHPVSSTLMVLLVRILPLFFRNYRSFERM